MNWEAIGEIVGALAVFGTLLYLAFQLKQGPSMEGLHLLKNLQRSINLLNYSFPTRQHSI